MANKTPTLNKLKSKLTKLKKSGVEYLFVKIHFLSRKEWDVESAEIQKIDIIIRCVERLIAYFKYNVEFGVPVGNNDSIYITDSSLSDMVIEPLTKEQYKQFDLMFGDSGQIGYCTLTDIAIYVG